MDEYIKIPNVFKRESGGKNRLIEGEFSSPELEYLSNCQWFFTEKVDGTNIRVIWDGYRVSFKGRTDKANIPKHLAERLEELFGGNEKEELFEELFGEKQAVLYGEGYGERIQKHGELYGSVDFILFDVVINGFWLDMANTADVATKLGIRSVPVIGKGTLYEAIEMIKEHPKSKLRDYEMEGVVCRPETQTYLRSGKPIMVKIKCCDF